MKRLSITEALIVLLGALLCAVMIGMIVSIRDCTAAGGISVRGLFWLECVKECGP